MNKGGYGLLFIFTETLVKKIAEIMDGIFRACSPDVAKIADLKHLFLGVVEQEHGLWWVR